ncbi:unnamed protein product [Brassica rapa]|uniref:Uncharacterized protein n=2 Tax=Brassica TaxID=3705 RepID=A0A8D9H919_BRACM|nr:unnamed protein product [Brassica napus]CAG7895293.1 unnamed protein product [Brassica rapa]
MVNLNWRRLDSNKDFRKKRKKEDENRKHTQMQMKTWNIFDKRFNVSVRY